MLNLTCPHCGSPIPPADVNPHFCTATCRQCGEQFEYDDEGDAPVILSSSTGETAYHGTATAKKPAEQTPPESPAPPGRPQVQPPRGITLATDHSDLVITQRMGTPAVYFFILLCLAFYTLLGATLFPGRDLGDKLYYYIEDIWQLDKRAIMIFFAIFIVIIAILTWMTLVYLLNSREIRVSAENVSVRNYPIPYPGNKKLPTAGIFEVSCDEIPGKYGPVGYAVVIAYRNARDRRLLWLDSPAPGNFLAEQIAQHLRVKGGLQAENVV